MTFHKSVGATRAVIETLDEFSISTIPSKDEYEYPTNCRASTARDPLVPLFLGIKCYIYRSCSCKNI